MTSTDQTTTVQPKAGITVRPYQPQDASTLLAIFRTAVRAIAPGNYSAAQLEIWAPAILNDEAFAEKRASTCTWVAELQGAPVGFSDLHGDGHIQMLYVHPEFQRRGIARLLLEHIESKAREQSLRRLYAEASVPARAVFEAVGFRMIVVQTVTVADEDMTKYRMEKRLR